nr:retrotransposon protein, putative, Ty1-copia subclass [Tanacetum cinerariifolium]
MSGKMARKPYTHQVERAKDLLGLIHTDVCGPFKITSRQGASYFVTFTNAFNHYGYVYLLKHKHEVFETFKVFQKEVENQLGKTIKSLCSDRGGEYMSQDFLDHLKDRGIIAHRTPLYTSQYIGVSKRRNRTLVDMVRSMMSQTTLSKSFWDYALETATRILNMVPTKKVKKTPYEVCHGQAPKLSYLKVWGCEALVKRDTLTKPDKLEPRSIRTRHAPDRMCLYINAEEHELGDLGEPANYNAALLDPESDKWLNAMNVEMQSMKDNEEKLHIFLESRSTEIDHDDKLRLSKSQGASTPAELKRMQDVLYASAVGSIIGDIKRELKVSCYIDAGYLTNANDLKSQTGYVFILNGGVVDWKSAKQSIFATSFAEVEYITAFDASKEVVWVRKFISELGVVSTIEEPISCKAKREKANNEHSKHNEPNMGKLATKGVRRRVVTTCERSQVRVSSWGFSFKVRICGVLPIDASIRGWKGLPPGYVLWNRITNYYSRLEGTIEIID